MPFYAYNRVVFIIILASYFVHLHVIFLNNVQLMSFVRILVLLMFLCQFQIVRVEQCFGNSWMCVWSLKWSLELMEYVEECLQDALVKKQSIKLITRRYNLQSKVKGCCWQL